MGTRGILGFITKGVRRGTYNHFDSYPSGLGEAIIKFILAHTDEDLDQMVGKVEQVKWIGEDQSENLNEDALLKLHFPAIPFFTIGCYDNYWSPTVSPAQEVEAFRSQNPDFPADINDDEILNRYLPAPFSRSVGSTFLRLCWIPESGDIIQPSDQMQLLDRIWDGVQIHVVDGTNFENDGLFCEYTYWIDFENKIMEIKGVVEGVLTLPFKELKVGLLSKLNAEYWKGVEAAEALEKLVI